MTGQDQRTLSSRLAIARLGVLGVAAVSMIVVFAALGTDGVRDMLTDVGESRWGMAAFIAAYALAVVVLLPGTLGTLTAGAVFGFPAGGVAALAGASLGATLAFLVSRAMGRDGAQALFGERLARVDDFIGKNDFVSILVLRLMPIVPFNLLNYGAGLTSVRFSRYVAASVLGMAPITLLAAALADRADDPTGAPFLVLLGSFIAALAISGFYGRRLRSRRAHA